MFVDNCYKRRNLSLRNQNVKTITRYSALKSPPTMMRSRRPTGRERWFTILIDTALRQRMRKRTTRPNLKRLERPMPYSVMRRSGGCTTVVRTWRTAVVTASTTLIPTAFSRLSSVEAWEAWGVTTSSSGELLDMDRVSVSSLVKTIPSSAGFCHHVKILSSNIRNV